MSFEFLAVDAARPEGGRTPLARSPMERVARAAGARFEERDGWNVAVASEAGRCSWTDLSHLGKLELHGSPAAVGIALELGKAMRDGETWWCPITRERVLAICPTAETAALRRRLEEAAGAAAVVEVTTAYAALAISGPRAREVFARFCAIDLRPAVMPVGAFRPGSVARTPGMVLREAEDRYLMLFGAALGEYMWTVVADAAEGADA
jgi:heterotetrameric sarcosine oxidase gamma subunit